MLNYIKNVLENMPASWLSLTTHRLDIYNEKLAKTQFLEQFEVLYKDNNSEASALNELSTAYDYVRLGHPLSCILEWAIAHMNDLEAENVLCFSSKTTPILAVLRENFLTKKNTRIVYTKELPACFDGEIIRNVYGYSFELKKIENVEEVAEYNGSTILVSQQDEIGTYNLNTNIDFFINVVHVNGQADVNLGSVILVNGKQNDSYISGIQHVRRRETIAMTPDSALIALNQLIAKPPLNLPKSDDTAATKKTVLGLIKEITGTSSRAVIASSGLSMQYAIVMGLIHDAMEKNPGKAIRIVVPPNCYGGTNDQARRVAECIDSVEIMDLPVDKGNNMVQSTDIVLDNIAAEDAIPFIIAEIPTSPRIEVPDLIKLEEVLSKKRKNANGEIAIDPVFILDQTFCPNVHFLGEEDILKTVRTVAYVSGSKFPSGGKCTAGYCVANKKAETLMEKIDLHLRLCDNEATPHQMEILAKQMPSMNQRIQDAYKNTREFTNFIKENLPEAKINFVSEELAEMGFTPSVFSVDLPTRGNSEEEREAFKRKLNHKLIGLMISEIPNESEYCVSYGQLAGCYWTIPATSTQGTTKEGDKDYIARVALSASMDLELHKKVFLDFVENI